MIWMFFLNFSFFWSILFPKCIWYVSVSWNWDGAFTPSPVHITRRFYLGEITMQPVFISIHHGWNLIFYASFSGCFFKSTTGFTSGVISNPSGPVMRHSATSPSWMWNALGVPVERMSPAYHPWMLLCRDTRRGGLWVMFATTFSAWTSPLWTLWTRSSLTSGTSSGVTSSGPKEKKVGTFFTMVNYLGLPLT